MATLRGDWLPAMAAFEAAARHQNFAHAAGELHLTASAVSHHVRKLEARLGVALFVRHARGVSLTADGRRLADAAGNALADVDGAVRALQDARGSEQRVRLAALHSFVHAWLLPRLPRFAADNPGVRIEFDVGIAPVRFDDDGPDFAVRHGPGQWPGLAAQLLLREALFPVAAPSLPGAAEARNAGDVARLPLVADLGRQGWPDWCRHAGVRNPRLDQRYVFNDSTDMLEAAALGLGAALAREHTVAAWLGSGRLRRLPGPMLPGRFAHHVVHPAHRPLRPAAQRVVDWLLAEAAAVNAAAGVSASAPALPGSRRRRTPAGNRR